MKTTKVLTVIGTIGSGKSTAMPLIAAALKAHPVEADNLFQTTNPFREGYLSDLPRWGFTSELWMSVERGKMLSEEMAAAKKLKKTWLVVDSGLVMSWVYMKMHRMFDEVDKNEWELYEKLFDQLAEDKKTDVVVWLDVSVETALERVRKRGRDYELKFYTKEYLSNLNRAVTDVAAKMEKDGVKVIRLPEEEVGNIVENDSDKQKLIKLVQEGLVGEG